MWINPPVKIVPHKCTISSCLIENYVFLRENTGLTADVVFICRSWTRRRGGDQEASVLQHHRLECQCLHSISCTCIVLCLTECLGFLTFPVPCRNSSAESSTLPSNRLQDDLTTRSISIRSSQPKHPEVPTVTPPPPPLHHTPLS